MTIDLLEIVIVRELFTSHDATPASEECHTRFSANSPLDHLAIGLARMVHETSDGTTSSVNDHFVVEAHEIVALS